MLDMGGRRCPGRNMESGWDPPDLHRFHKTSRNLDFVAPLEGLLEAFRRGEIADRARIKEDVAIRTHLRELSEAWEAVLPRFPVQPWTRRTIRWEYHRGRRDAYLTRLIIAALEGLDEGSRLIVNPAAVFGRHARSIARGLPDREVVGTDIEPLWNRIYRVVSAWKYPALRNYSFKRENIFEPDMDVRPVAVTFFGACGEVTDACMSYAVHLRSPFLVCRSCCHENIAGNTRVVRRPGALNAIFRLKNRSADFWRDRDMYPGYYRHERFGPHAYPRSSAARAIIDTETIVDVARNSVDSDVCRSIIDLDRCLYLQERGYDVLYREELFFAHRPVG
jgi:hypothetical protein